MNPIMVEGFRSRNEAVVLSNTFCHTLILTLGWLELALPCLWLDQVELGLVATCVRALLRFLIHIHPMFFLTSWCECIGALTCLSLVLFNLPLKMIYLSVVDRGLNWLVNISLVLYCLIYGCHEIYRLAIERDIKSRELLLKLRW